MERTTLSVWNRLTAPRRPLADPVAARNTRLANTMILLTCLGLMLGMILVVSRMGLSGITVNGIYTAIGLALFVWTPQRYTWKSVAVCMWITVYIVDAAADRLTTGIQNALLLMQALFVFLFEMRHARQIALATAAVAGLFVWLLLGTEGILNPSPLAIQLMFNSFAFAFTLYVISHSAFRTLAQAEQALAQEHERSERLLSSILPERVAQRLKENPNTTVAEDIPDATVLFADLAGFTSFAAQHPPEEVVAFLNALFSRFDDATERHRLDKVKTIGDGYMVAGGLDGDTHDHSVRMAQLAQEMMQIAAPILAEANMALRIGLHRGPVTAGVIGQRRPFFDVWGDTVNVASRMETQGAPGKIQMSHTFAKTVPEALRAGTARRVGVDDAREVTAFWLKVDAQDTDGKAG